MNICTQTGKQSLSKADALRKVDELARDLRDQQSHQLNAYRCLFCKRHHVGHRREPGDSTPLRRLNG